MKRLYDRAIAANPDFTNTDEFGKFIYLNSLLQMQTANFIRKAYC